MENGSPGDGREQRSEPASAAHPCGPGPARGSASCHRAVTPTGGSAETHRADATVRRPAPSWGVPATPERPIPLLLRHRAAPPAVPRSAPAPPVPRSAPHPQERPPRPAAPPTPLTVPLRHRDPLDSPQLPRRKCRKCPSPSPPPIGQLVGRARRLAERRGHAPRPCQQERGAQDGGGGCEGHRGRLGPQPAGAPRPSVPALGRQPRRQVSPGSAAGEGRRLLYGALTTCPPLAGSSSSSTT